MATRRSILLLFLLSLPFCAPAGRDNQGTEFIMCFMDNQVTGTVTDLEIFITTMSNNDAYVNVTLPLYDPNFLETAVVQRTIITKVILPHGMRGTGTAIENKGIHIQSDEEIVVFGVNKEIYSTDAYQALPVDVLSTEYYAMTSESEAMLALVATENGTDVNITLPNALQGALSFSYNGASYTNGQTISITLDRFETFHMYDSSGYSDLTGAHITSSHPVGVLAGNYKICVPASGGGSSDHLTEQLPPVDTLGRTFYTYSTPERLVGDLIRVLAVEDNTTVTHSGSITITLDRAEYVEMDINTGDYIKIESDKGILVGLFSKTHKGTGDGANGGDPAMTFLLPRPQWAADYTYSTIKTPTNTQFVNQIVVHIDRDDVDGLRLDLNNVTGVTWENITGDSEIVMGVISVSDGSHNIYHIDPTITFSAISTGVAVYNSYAFASGTRMALINLPCTNTITSHGDIVDNDCDGMIDEETDNGLDDDGDGLIDEDLANLPRVEGNWAAWSSWTVCTEICEAIGNQTRNRTCDNPVPANGGQYCVGNETELIDCNMTHIQCYLDGNWTAWGQWDNCTGTCGTGTQTRDRNCTNPAPQGGGNYCSGSVNETISCVLAIACPSSSNNIVAIAAGASVGGLAAIAAAAACCCLLYPIARKKIFDDDDEEEEELEDEDDGISSIGGFNGPAEGGMPPVGTNRISPA